LNADTYAIEKGDILTAPERYRHHLLAADLGRRHSPAMGRANTVTIFRSQNSEGTIGTA